VHDNASLIGRFLGTTACVSHCTTNDAKRTETHMYPLFYPYYLGLMWMGLMMQAFQSETNALNSATREAIEKSKENVEAAVHDGNKAATLVGTRVNLLSGTAG
jgi:hypothetical protein